MPVYILKNRVLDFAARNVLVLVVDTLRKLVTVSERLSMEVMHQFLFLASVEYFLLSLSRFGQSIICKQTLTNIILYDYLHI